MIMKTSNIHFSQKYFCHEKKSHTPSYKSLINMNKCIRINLKYHHHDFFYMGIQLENASIGKVIFYYSVCQEKSKCILEFKTERGIC